MLAQGAGSQAAAIHTGELADGALQPGGIQKRAGREAPFPGQPQGFAGKICNYLRQTQSGAGSHGLVVQLGLGGENPLVQPGLQIAAPAVAPEQGHGDVGVGEEERKTGVEIKVCVKLTAVVHQGAFVNDDPFAAPDYSEAYRRIAEVMARPLKLLEKLACEIGTVLLQMQDVVAAEIYSYLGNSYISVGNKTKAKEMFNEYLKLRPNDEAVRKFVGTL